MCDMGVGHEEAVGADAGEPATRGRAPVHGAELTKHVAVTDAQLGGLTLVLLVLGRRADGGELKDLVVLTDTGRALDHSMCADGAARTDDHIGADDRKGTDGDSGGELRPGRYQRVRIDHDAVGVTWTPRVPPSCRRWPPPWCRRMLRWRTSRCP